MALTVRKFAPPDVAAPHDLDPSGRLNAFKNSALPLDLEIGCGVGLHPIQYTKAHPERQLIAIEHTREKFESFERRFLNHGSPENLLPVHADAVRWVTHALAPVSIDRIFILYPNPEPKSASQRWLRMPFSARLLEVLKPGGTIVLATNIAEYVEEAITYGTEAWHLKMQERRAFQLADERPGVPRTHFEKKYLARGETCFDVTFMKL